MAEITNTTKKVSADPLNALLAAFGNPSGFITDMEAAGQAELVSVAAEGAQPDGRTRCQIPTHGMREAEAIGIEMVTGDAGEDPLFRAAYLPAGWSIKPSEHAMWSHLLDGAGRERGSIFYKAAFYDRSARFSANRRYRYEVIGRDRGEEASGYSGTLSPVVRDFDNSVVWQGEGVTITEPEGYVRREWDNPVTKAHNTDFFKKQDEIEHIAEAKILEMFPDYQNPAAYWD